jgi:hypothetical protein
MFIFLVNSSNQICILWAGCQWLTPVILATWEAAIERIRQPQTKSSQD